jgi:hypothetical protein
LELIIRQSKFHLGRGGGLAMVLQSILNGVLESEMTDVPSGLGL